MYSPITGVVKEANTSLEDEPKLVNDSCYEKGQSNFCHCMSTWTVSWPFIIIHSSSGYWQSLALLIMLHTKIIVKGVGICIKLIPIPVRTPCSSLFNLPSVQQSFLWIFKWIYIFSIINNYRYLLVEIIRLTLKLIYMCKLIYSSEIQISAIENSCGSMEFENLLGKSNLTFAKDDHRHLPL